MSHDQPFSDTMLLPAESGRVATLITQINTQWSEARDSSIRGLRQADSLRNESPGDRRKIKSASQIEQAVRGGINDCLGYLMGNLEQTAKILFAPGDPWFIGRMKDWKKWIDTRTDIGAEILNKAKLKELELEERDRWQRYYGIDFLGKRIACPKTPDGSLADGKRPIPFYIAIEQIRRRNDQLDFDAVTVSGYNLQLIQTELSREITLDIPFLDSIGEQLNRLEAICLRRERDANSDEAKGPERPWPPTQPRPTLDCGEALELPGMAGVRRERPRRR